MKKITALLLMLSVLPYSVSAAQFRPLHTAWLKEGQVIHPDTLRQVMKGMTKDQVYRVLGTPHFNEAIGAKRWHYIFQLRAGNINLGSNCQYMLQYHRGRIDQIIWQNEDCARGAR
jgi:OmpA-OmpF porin, OOP family